MLLEYLIMAGYILLISLLLTVTTLLLKADDDFSQWHSPDGRTVSAKPVNVVGDQVRITLSDGRSMNVRPDIFTSDDEKRLTTWAVQHLANRKSLLEISTSRIKKKTNKYTKEAELASGKVKEDGYEITEFDTFYEITISNQSDFSLQDLCVEYRLVSKTDELAKTEKDQFQYTTKSGKLNLNLPPRGEVKSATDKIKLVETELGHGLHYANRGDEESKAELIGIWMRIYYNGEMIDEQIKPTSVQGMLEWEHTEAKK